MSAPDHETIAVVAPLREKLAPFLRQVAERQRAGSGHTFTGHVNSRRLVLGWTGDGRQAPAPDPEWTDRVEARKALIFSHDRIAATAVEKAELGRRLLAESAASDAVVDLETAVYARAASAHGVPYTAIRAVSDAVDEDLPLDFNRYLDAGGPPSPRRRPSWDAERLRDAALFVLRENLWCVILPLMVDVEEICEPEWADWYRMTPEERWNESARLWHHYVAMGGSLDPEPDPQSPFYDPETSGRPPVDGRPGLRVVRRSGV